MKDYQLLTSDEVAGLFRISKRTVERLAKSGVLPCIKVGGSVRFREQAIAAILGSTSEADSNVCGFPEGRSETC